MTVYLIIRECNEKSGIHHFCLQMAPDVDSRQVNALLGLMGDDYSLKGTNVPEEHVKILAKYENYLIDSSQLVTYESLFQRWLYHADPDNEHWYRLLKCPKLDMIYPELKWELVAKADIEGDMIGDPLNKFGKDSEYDVCYNLELDDVPFVWETLHNPYTEASHIMLRDIVKMFGVDKLDTIFDDDEMCDVNDIADDE